MRTTSILLVLAASVVIGCSGDGSDSGGDGNQTAATPMAGDKLVGVWFGIAVLDDDKLARKLESIGDANVKQQVMIRANAFQSTLIGAQFKRDGTMELDVEIMGVDGQKYREAVVGTWRAIQQTSDEVVVETTEQTADGESGRTSIVHYRFIEDNNHIATLAPAAEDISDCNPLFLFERQEFSHSSQAQLPSARKDNR